MRAGRKRVLTAVVAAAAAAAAVVALVSTNGGEGSSAPIEATRSSEACDKVASPRGSDANPGTPAKPYLSVEKLANSLRPAQAGCLRAGTYERDVRVTNGGARGNPITITSFPGERATVRGRLHVTDEANYVVVQQLELDGRNAGNLPSPTVNGDHVVFRDNEVTNSHTTICFLLGSEEYGRARDTLIERNLIHDCGRLPPTNHHHGIYVEAADGARITENWIYDNADRGVQLFPDAQDTYVARNVIDGNGQGVIFSRESGSNVVERNVISNPVLRYNLESFETRGSGNVARSNCLWSPRHPGRAGVQSDIAVRVVDNLTTNPGYVNRDDKDFRLRPDSPCVRFSPGSKRPGPRQR
jgi:hypothetical protein